MKNGKPKFDLGRLIATPGALKAMGEAGQTPLEFITRQARGDWGDLCNQDKKLNDEALVDGSRLLSSFQTSNGEKLYVITEAQDDDGHRAATTCLLASEY